MTHVITRRRFLSQCSAAGATLAGVASAQPVNRKGPYDYAIVEGHRDIWEFNDRFRTRLESQRSPLVDHLLPRLLEGGVDVVIMPVGGDHPRHRAFNDRTREGSLQVVDMLLVEVEKARSRAGIIRSKADLPTAPDRNKVMFFLDIEGGSPIEVEPETDYHPDRRLAMLRNFYRLGVRGMQLTHNGRNQLGDGHAEGRPGNRLSTFGVEVVQEMNRLGMLIGVSHLSMNGIMHVVEITKDPIVSTHTNIHPFLTTSRQHGLEEIKAIASTGGVIGLRYISNERTPYSLLVDEIQYIQKTVGVQHAGIGWLGHDAGHPRIGYVPGITPHEPKPIGVEAETMREHWANLINLLQERGFTDDEISMIVGGNFLRVMTRVLKD